MNTMILGLFTNNKHAGEAVNELKERGYTKDISVLAQDEKHETPKLSEVKTDVSEGAETGTVAGTAIGALAGIFSGITSLTVPGVGLIVGGPLLALLGVTGAAAGSLAGGLVGALVDLGISEATAELYNERIQKGEVL